MDSKGRARCPEHINVDKKLPCPTCGRCHAHSSQTKDPCRRWPVVGGGVCLSHGGSHAEARKAFATRLLALGDPAIAGLAKVLTDKNATNADLVNAFKAWADRSGLGTSSRVEVDTPRHEAFIAGVVRQGGTVDRRNRYTKRTEPIEDEGYEDEE